MIVLYVGWNKQRVCLQAELGHLLLLNRGETITFLCVMMSCDLRLIV